MNYKYFHLNPECYLVLGDKKAVIHNLLTTQVIWLNEEQTNIITRAENGQITDTSNPFLAELVKQNWGFFSEKHYFVDKLRSRNLFSEKQFYKERPRVLSATLHLTNECNLNCSFCGENYCPTCLKYGNNQEIKIVEAIQIIDALKPYGLRQIVLCGGEPALYADLDKIVDHALQSGIFVVINTNGIFKIKADITNTKLVINLFHQEHLEIIEENYRYFNDVLILYYDMNPIKPSNPTWKALRKDQYLSNITVQSMNKISIIEFDITKYHNRCLNSRIHVMNNLDIITCLGDQTMIGNMKDDNLRDIIYNLYDSQWKNSKPSNEFAGCHKCEFRFSCSPCIIINKNHYCSVE